MNGVCSQWRYVDYMFPMRFLSPLIGSDGSENIIVSEECSGHGVCKTFTPEPLLTKLEIFS